MKYYLLTFDDDYADEHNVPALACMTEEEYLKWRKTPSGKLNPKYEEQKVAYEANEKRSKDFWALLKKEGAVLNGSPNTGAIPKDRPDLIAAEKDYRKNYSHLRHPKRVFSDMNAYLGNGGDSFDDGYTYYYLMEEFVDAGIVKVTEVDESFHATFHRANLASLSLCNVFTIDEYRE